MMSESLLISVIICTFNRAKLLTGALQTLCQQTLGPDDYEIIIVDNASTDNTADVVAQTCDLHPTHQIRLIHEAKQGLGYSRNTGFKVANGTYVAFMDDDAQASADWLEIVLRCFEELDPKPICIGGPIKPFYISSKPDWFDEAYEIRTWGNEARFLTARESFSGSNMTFKKTILEAHNGFAVDVGVSGDRLSVGEETSLFDRIWNASQTASIFYSPQAIVYHLVPPQKMTLSYQLTRAFASGQSIFIIHEPKTPKARFRFFFARLRDFAVLSGSAIANVRSYPSYHNWIVEKLGPIFEVFGHLTKCVGISISVKQR